MGESFNSLFNSLLLKPMQFFGLCMFLWWWEYYIITLKIFYIENNNMTTLFVVCWFCEFTLAMHVS